MPPTFSPITRFPAHVVEPVHQLALGRLDVGRGALDVDLDALDGLALVLDQVRDPPKNLRHLLDLGLDALRRVGALRHVLVRDQELLLPRAGHAARSRRRVVRPRQGVEDGRAGARRRLAVRAFPNILAPLGVLLHGRGPRPRRRAQVPRDFVEVRRERRLDGRAVFVGEGALSGRVRGRCASRCRRRAFASAAAARPSRSDRRVHQMRDLLGGVEKMDAPRTSVSSCARFRRAFRASAATSAQAAVNAAT